ncbi:MAG: hypothetical protein AAF806_10425 [Bacteroidota bacterium]
MTTPRFDTHEAISNFVQGGFTPEQAEAIIKFEKAKDESGLVTKSDLAQVEYKLEKKITKLEHKTENGLAALRQEIADTKIWILKVMFGQAALIVGLLKILEQSK